jgi:hypothetical protein
MSNIESDNKYYCGKCDYGLEIKNGGLYRIIKYTQCKDITNSHNEIVDRQNDDTFFITVVNECVDASKKLDWTKIPAHFAIKYPYFFMGMMSPDTIMQFAQYDYDWKHYELTMIKNILLFTRDSDTLVKKLEILFIHYGIDVAQTDFGVLLFGTPFMSPSHEVIAAKILINMGCKFAPDTKLDKDNIIALMGMNDDILGQLIDNGLNLQKIVTYDYFGHIVLQMSHNEIKKLIKHGIEAELIIKKMLEASGIGKLIVNLISDHGVDIQAILDQISTKNNQL